MSESAQGPENGAQGNSSTVSLPEGGRKETREPHCPDEAGAHPDSPASQDETLSDKISRGVDARVLFDAGACDAIEERIDEVCRTADRGAYRVCTVDRAPLRNKYFFGEGYIYGQQLGSLGARRPPGPGSERLYPRGECDPIPQWIFDLVVTPIEESGIVPRGFVNSAVINDYYPGGCIVSHVDPPKLFSRPIVTASFFSQSALSFGCKFSFRPMRTTEPVYSVPLPRGCVMSMTGYAADGITHCVRPEDVPHRRAVIILRHVPENAPRLTFKELDWLRHEGRLPPERQPRTTFSRNVPSRKRRLSGDHGHTLLQSLKPQEVVPKENPRDPGKGGERMRAAPVPLSKGNSLLSSDRFESFKVVCSRTHGEDQEEKQEGDDSDRLHKRLKLDRKRLVKITTNVDVERSGGFREGAAAKSTEKTSAPRSGSTTSEVKKHSEAIEDGLRAKLKERLRREKEIQRRRKAGREDKSLERKETKRSRRRRDSPSSSSSSSSSDSSSSRSGDDDDARRSRRKRKSRSTRSRGHDAKRKSERRGKAGSPPDSKSRREAREEKEEGRGRGGGGVSRSQIRRSILKSVKKNFEGSMSSAIKAGRKEMC